MNTKLLIFSLGALVAGCSRQENVETIDVLAAGDPKAAYRDGRAEAQKDIAGGKIILKTYGLPAPWSELYRSNLLSQYQIVSRPVAGCAVTETFAQGVKGYNEVS